MKKNLTEGNIVSSLILFSLPMILGNLLQQCYNVVDTLIVGKTIGANALAAVGSSYALMVLLTSVILGLCMGSGVVFAQLFGAKRYDELKVSIVNAFGLILIITLVIYVFSFLFLDQFIIWLNIPLTAIPYTKEYLNIIFLGMLFVFLYSFFASVLRSVGNTLIPLVFLAVSAILNILLDLIFILGLQWGVAGAAWATVIAQAVSALVLVAYFFIKMPNLSPKKEHFIVDGSLLNLILVNSTLTALQQSIMNFGILMVQGLVNSFGFAVSAAFAAVVKIDAFAYMPVQDFGNAFATFIAQNVGAQKDKRIHEGIKKAMMISTIFCIIASSCVVMFAKELMLLFIQAEETEIIRIGIEYLHIEGSFYVGIGILFLLYGFYRGLGQSMMSIVLTVISLGSRVVLAYSLSAIPSIGLVGIWWAVPIGWVLADFVGITYYLRIKRKVEKKTLLI